MNGRYRLRLKYFAVSGLLSITAAKAGSVEAISWPLRPAWTYDFGSNGVLLASAASHTVAVGLWAIDSEGLVSLDPRNGEPLWRQPQIRNRGAKVEAQQPLVLSTAFVITAVDPLSGRVLWTHGQEPAGARSMSTDPEDYDPYRYHAIAEGRMLSVREGGTAECLSLATGAQVWSGLLDPRPSAAPVFNGNELAWIGPSGEFFTLASVVATDSGDRHGPYYLPAVVRRVFIPPGGPVIAVNIRGVTAHSPEAPPIFWEGTFPEPLADAAVLGHGHDLYLPSTDGSVRRLDLFHPGLVWQSGLPTVAPLAGLRLELSGGELLVVARKFAMVLDAETGRVVFSARLPAGREIVDFYAADGHLLLLMVESSGASPEVTLHAFAFRSGEEELPGSGRHLGALRSLRGMTLASGTLVIQDGNQLRAWRATSDAPGLDEPPAKAAAPSAPPAGQAPPGRPD